MDWHSVIQAEYVDVGVHQGDDPRGDAFRAISATEILKIGVLQLCNTCAILPAPKDTGVAVLGVRNAENSLKIGKMLSW